MKTRARPTKRLTLLAPLHLSQEGGAERGNVDPGAVGEALEPYRLPNTPDASGQPET